MKNAVVTGHMSGMGKGAYELLKQKGYNVIGWDIQGEGDEKVDVRSAKEVAEAAARLTEPVDAVVLSAGVWKEMPLLETTDEDWSLSLIHISPAKRRWPGRALPGAGP